MSSLRGEGQGWSEALLQRGVEDEVRAAKKNLAAIFPTTGTTTPPATMTPASTKLSTILAISIWMDLK